MYLIRNNHGSKSQGELQNHRYVPTRAESPALEFDDSETASLPDSAARHDFEVFQPTRFPILNIYMCEPFTLN